MPADAGAPQGGLRGQVEKEPRKGSNNATRVLVQSGVVSARSADDESRLQ